MSACKTDTQEKDLPRADAVLVVTLDPEGVGLAYWRAREADLLAQIPETVTFQEPTGHTTMYRLREGVQRLFAEYARLKDENDTEPHDQTKLSPERGSP